MSRVELVALRIMFRLDRVLINLLSLNARAYLPDFCLLDRFLVNGNGRLNDRSNDILDHVRAGDDREGTEERLSSTRRNVGAVRRALSECASG